MKHIILTNNKTIVDDENQIVLVPGEFRDVLVEARNYIHLGHRLKVSPLPASIRMFYSPVRSVVISKEPSEIDSDSVIMIENAIEMYDKSLGERNIDYSNLNDYEIIDRQLLQSALTELRTAEL
ncbi:MAG: GrdX family protein [Tissierellia bacterium]|nr:GrdX family protein [Tissierellia bacterium]